jgi:hypothetical protein
LRQALLGTWRLISFQLEVDGTLVKPYGDDPLGYLVYTADGHVFVQLATRAERGWTGPEVLQVPDSAARTAIGFRRTVWPTRWAWCGGDG